MRHRIKQRKGFRAKISKKILCEAVQIIRPSISSMPQKIESITLTSLLQVICLLVIFLSTASLTQAQISGQRFSIDFDNGLLTLSAKQASLKRLLRQLSETLDIYVKYPRDLNKQITIKLYNVPPIKALRRILKGQNYALIYSASRPDKASAISELHILPKPVGPSAPGKYKRQKSREERIQASIRNYEKRLERLRDRLARTNSEGTERRISNQIRSHERTIKRLQKQLGR